MLGTYIPRPMRKEKQRNAVFILRKPALVGCARKIRGKPLLPLKCLSISTLVLMKKLMIVVMVLALWSATGVQDKSWSDFSSSCPVV